MHPIESTVLNTISKYPDMPLVIAYSGGVDSQVLLHAIASLTQRFIISNPVTVCHVNHGLSKNAADWQVFAEQACLALKLKLKVCQVNVQARTSTIIRGISP
ncbi:ATP-binding protein [Colwellia maritima]|uniref:ATP-binding protein n=1 Tax=Colwellia maritima TaxID=2912588 RepID=UPI00237ABF49|nr:ATP-binding protein [Colwellia maritima]